ncbi:MAG TPA: serine hydrolase domain-containing protein [Gemmatimonas sp.]|uniref:serine hydrolase domain-containing protein n=1 Tax=Gemmatimonas sp. TaxID=1962908 RepID=UPI002EDA1F3A
MFISVKRVLYLLAVTSAMACAQPGVDRLAACPAVAGDEINVAAADSLFHDLARDSTRDIKGVVVQRHGCIVAERYFNGDDSTSLHDIRSATKSITAALVAIAMQQRLIRDIDQPISELLPAGMIATAQPIRVRDVLTMRTGLDSDDEDSLSTGNEDRMDESDDWMAFARTVPAKSSPGTHYVYSSFTAFLAGAMVEHVSHRSLQDFAAQHLFGPLGIERFAWRRGPKGEGVGQGNLSIATRDMAKIGELFLRGGRVGDRQVINSAWVRDALASHVDISKVDRFADAYGYMWYTKQHQVGTSTVTVHFASGNGGNKIYLVPDRDLVVAITSSAYGRGYGQRRSEQILLRVLAATTPQNAQPGRAGD